MIIGISSSWTNINKRFWCDNTSYNYANLCAIGESLCPRPDTGYAKWKNYALPSITVNIVGVKLSYYINDKLSMCCI